MDPAGGCLAQLTTALICRGPPPRFSFHDMWFDCEPSIFDSFAVRGDSAPRAYVTIWPRQVGRGVGGGNASMGDESAGVGSGDGVLGAGAGEGAGEVGGGDVGRVSAADLGGR